MIMRCEEKERGDRGNGEEGVGEGEGEGVGGGKRIFLSVSRLPNFTLIPEFCQGCLSLLRELHL